MTSNKDKNLKRSKSTQYYATPEYRKSVDEKVVRGGGWTITNFSIGGGIVLAKLLGIRLDYDEEYELLPEEFQKVITDIDIRK